MKLEDIPAHWKRTETHAWKPVKRFDRKGRLVDAGEKMPIVECSFCKTKFLRCDPRVIYCTMQCKGKNKRGPLADNWKGGKIKMHGYIYLFMPGNPMATRGRDKNYVAEHRFVMSQIIGRSLLPSECVHHKNEIITDNRPENLVILSRSEHQSIHARGNLVKRKRDEEGRFI